ncbi:unnamed protein product [Arabis nemorensis]|uniref:Reverse transcriptase zinc-binding domain-containing protein n=1 Tax=Arabis nemorensis TaxID=586526 RepID=A0A565BAU5_9BRAS|nr:unnamed protein product [Arabis nemorensis]
MADQLVTINTSKSALYNAGITQNYLQEKAQDLGIPIEQLPIRYLGLPLTTRLDCEPLIDKIRSRLLGDGGTRVFGVRRDAKVSEAGNENGWSFRHCRGAYLQDILRKICETPPPNVEAGEDRILWKREQHEYKGDFSTKHTWNLVRSSRRQIDWYRLVWFRQTVPHQAFITWLAFRDRLATSARTRAWGIDQPCVFCGELNETREHLFFACPYSFTVWSKLCATLLRSRLNPDWQLTINSLLRNRLNKTDSLLDITNLILSLREDREAPTEDGILDQWNSVCAF